MSDSANTLPFLSDEYAKLVDFANVHNSLTYAEFDLLTKNQVNLFAIRENFDFEALEDTLERISSALPAMKRILSKPIIRLKDTDAILPVESVRVVNSKTVTHTAGHSELWDDITSDGLRPRALLTLQNKDDYTIYENVVLARVIDQTLMLVSKNIRMMRDMLYACHDMKFNLLERDNHIEYFLAIGKLHMAYVRDYDKYVLPAQRCLSKLLFIDSTLRARLGAPVYKKCRKKGGKITLKKTNIFRNHKDYRRIYLLMKWYQESGVQDGRETNVEIPLQNDAYTLFCSMISIFAAGHFGFEFPRTKKIDFHDLRVSAIGDKWKLAISTERSGALTAIRFTLVKDAPYSVILVPITKTDDLRDATELAKAKFEASEYVLATCEQCDGEGAYLSVFDIQSFRKIQQILLRAMVYSDKKRDICPFCKAELTADPENEGAFECRSCRTLISERTCSDTGEKYFVTAIKNHKSETLFSKDKFTANRQLLSAMHFRNITAIDHKMEIVCPRCKRVHTAQGR